jgi:hypothetical protein
MTIPVGYPAKTDGSEPLDIYLPAPVPKTRYGGLPGIHVAPMSDADVRKAARAALAADANALSGQTATYAGAQNGIPTLDAASKTRLNGLVNSPTSVATPEIFDEWSWITWRQSIVGVGRMSAKELLFIKADKERPIRSFWDSYGPGVIMFAIFAAPVALSALGVGAAASAASVAPTVAPAAAIPAVATPVAAGGITTGVAATGITLGGTAAAALPVIKGVVAATVTQALIPPKPLPQNPGTPVTPVVTTLPVDATLPGATQTDTSMIAVIAFALLAFVLVLVPSHD